MLTPAGGVGRRHAATTFQGKARRQQTRRAQQERTWSPHHLHQMRKAAAQAQAMHQNQQRTWSPASWHCGSTPPPPLCGTASTPPAPAPGSLRRQGRAQAVHGVSHSPTCLVQAGRGLDLEPAAHAQVLADWLPQVRSSSAVRSHAMAVEPRSNCRADLRPSRRRHPALASARLLRCRPGPRTPAAAARAVSSRC